MGEFAIPELREIGAPRKVDAVDSASVVELGADEVGASNVKTPRAELVELTTTDVVELTNGNLDVKAADAVDTPMAEAGERELTGMAVERAPEVVEAAATVLEFPVQDVVNAEVKTPRADLVARIEVVLA